MYYTPEKYLKPVDHGCGDVTDAIDHNGGDVHRPPPDRLPHLVAKLPQPAVLCPLLGGGRQAAAIRLGCKRTHDGTKVWHMES